MSSGPTPLPAPIVRMPTHPDPSHRALRRQRLLATAHLALAACHHRPSPRHRSRRSAIRDRRRERAGHSFATFRRDHALAKSTTTSSTALIDELQDMAGAFGVADVRTIVVTYPRSSARNRRMRGSPSAGRVLSLTLQPGRLRTNRRPDAVVAPARTSSCSHEATHARPRALL